MILMVVCLSTPYLSGQENEGLSKLTVNGYFSGMPSIAWNSDSSQWQVLLHNRVNIDWYPSASLTGSIQFRNQLLSGDMMEFMDFDNGFNKANYALPLTFYQNFGDKTLLSMAIDRAWLQYTRNKLEIKLGRQRINWGQTFVWNPNDIFNNYNFFDFDYPERPGADALRMVYYTSYNSSLDLAAKLDSAGNITGGGLFRFTAWNTEIQLLGAYFSQSNKRVYSDTLPAFEWEDKDLVTGFGFSGGIKAMSIRGEMSYLYSLKENNDSTDQIMASLTLDFTTAGNLGLMLEVFYVNRINLAVTDLLGTTGGSQNIKSLALTKYNLFGQVTYPVTPIVNATLAGMFFYDKDLIGFFTGPSVDISLGDNLGLGLISQFFAFRYENPYTMKDEWANVNYVFLRLKWNF